MARRLGWLPPEEESEAKATVPSTPGVEAFHTTTTVEGRKKAQTFLPEWLDKHGNPPFPQLLNNIRNAIVFSLFVKKRRTRRLLFLFPPEASATKLFLIVVCL